jgi:hypothetical protein
VTPQQAARMTRAVSAFALIVVALRCTAPTEGSDLAPAFAGCRLVPTHDSRHAGVFERSCEARRGPQHAHDPVPLFTRFQIGKLRNAGVEARLITLGLLLAHGLQLELQGKARSDHTVGGIDQT